MPNSAGNDSSTLQGGVRLGGVRADFVANLGKRLAELRQHWDALVDAPASPGLRNEFRRHLHALATRSRVLHFEAMADRLDRAERKLQRAAAAGGIDADDVELFDELFRELPTLAWIEVGGKQPAESRADSEEEAPEAPAKAAPAFPLAVLVIGRPPLAQSLEDQGIDPEGLALDVEQTERLDNALQLTQALAPDVVVLDGDLAGATIVSETLARDPITDSTPVIVVGTWSHADQASDFLAHGVVRTLPKPVSPAKLRKAIREAFENRNPIDQNDDIGTVTVDELAERLAQQVRASLIDAVRPESRRVSVDLGQGTEVLAAVWGAVARVREMLTIRSQGTIRFNNVGPVGAVPVAPWLDIKSTDDARRDGGRETEQDAKLLLDGRRVLVVDDDPAITWFLSGLFRAHGSTVKEAQDGMRGLELAFQFDPDLVITDILMPKLDGFGLCRALKRDVILRDVPVILLSWKEDLLQRVRELGVGADGYLRKEATSSAILRTVQESLRPRTRIEERLRQGGEVRGRLDGLTARTLLTLVSKTLPNACVNVRDARHLFEVQLRDGQIQQATRTSLDGASVRGDEALISVVRVFTGRFQVLPAQDAVEPSTTRPLRDIVATAVAEARAAQVLLEGANLLRVNRLALRLERLELESLPKATRDVYEALAKGTSPTRLMNDGVVTAASLEQLLSDAATRGAIASVLDAEGTDLLVDESKARLRAWMSPLEARPVQRAAKTREQQEAHASDDSPAQGPKPTMPCPAGAESDTDEVASSRVAVEQLEPPIDLSELAADEKSVEKDEPKASSRDLGDAPTSLAEAVIREVADSAEMPASKPSPSMLDVSELRPRSTARPAASSIPSLPPDAIVPGAESLAEQPEEPSEPSIPEVPSMPPPPEDVSVVAAQYELVGAVSAAQANEALKSPSTSEDEADENDDEEDDDEEDDDEEDDEDDDEGDEDEDDEEDDESASKVKAVGDQVKDGAADEIPKRSLLLPVLAAVGIVGGLIAAAVYLGGPTPPVTPAAPESSELEGPSIPIPAPPGSALPGAPDAVGTATKAVPGAYAGKVQEGLPIDGPGEAPVDQGLVEVKTGHPNAAVTIDGRDLGEGEVIRMFLGPGKHRVMVVWQGKQLRGEIDVQVGEKTRLSLEDAWEP